MTCPTVKAMAIKHVLELYAGGVVRRMNEAHLSSLDQLNPPRQAVVEPDEAPFPQRVDEAVDVPR